jgi:hypothetical protein
MSSDQPRIHAHVRSYDGGSDFGSRRKNVLVHATAREQWHHLIAKAPLNPSDVHRAACHVSAANLTTASRLKHPLLTSAGEANDNPTDAQLKAYQEPTLQQWQDKFAEFIQILNPFL